MAIRLNDIESILRIKADQAIAALRKTSDGAVRLGVNLDKTDQKLGKLAGGLNKTATVATNAFGAAEAASGKSFVAAEQATTALLTGVAVLAQSGSAIGQLTGALGGLTTTVAGASTAIGIGLVGAIVILGAFAAKTAIDLNRITRETEKINDQLTKSSPLVAQYRAEAAALEGTIRQYEKGQISANTALEEFNRFGLASIDQAQQRIDALRRILPGLETQAAAERAVKAEIDFRNSVEAQVVKNAEARRFAAAVAAEEEARFGLAAAERAKQAEDALRREIALIQERARQVVANLVAESEAKEQARIDEERANLGTGGLDPTILEQAPVTALQETVDLTDTLAESTQDAEAGFLAVGEAITRGLGSAANVTETIGAGVADFLKNGAGLIAAFGVGLANASAQGGKAVGKLFADMLKGLAAAIVKAVILNTILKSFGGGIGGGALGGLFQDPTADLFARSEGSRFADLFFQGVQQKIGSVRDRVEANLEENREVVDSTAPTFSVIVQEASPETRVEVTDRYIDPRIQERNLQRTGELKTARGLT